MVKLEIRRRRSEEKENTKGEFLSVRMELSEQDKKDLADNASEFLKKEFEAKGETVREVTGTEKIQLDKIKGSAVSDLGIFHIQVPERQRSRWEIIEFEPVG